MRILTLILLAAVLSGCSILQVTSTVETPEGLVYTVNSKSDALVSFKDPKTGAEVLVDNRGRPGMIEQALGIMFMNLPDVEIGVD